MASFSGKKAKEEKKRKRKGKIEEQEECFSLTFLLLQEVLEAHTAGGVAIPEAAGTILIAWCDTSDATMTVRSGDRSMMSFSALQKRAAKLFAVDNVR